MNAHLLVIAKAPVPGRVKTRLCPPCTPHQAAVLAAAALEDTLDAARATTAARRFLVLDGTLSRPAAGFAVVPQRGAGLDARLAAAFADTARAGVASFLVGMDTPQLTAARLDEALATLATADAVLGLAEDGGWWGLGLRDPAHAAALAGVPMSTGQTGRLTAAALRTRGVRIRTLPTLRDVDTVADAAAVAADAPWSRFAARYHETARSWELVP